ncbi:bifunctional serine/threonine-protein kinase/formylglycine-generating enzyme family protein [Rhodopirellula sp. P2]|uniref:bifunctional serine/threonine-protein kinase/formylglycine-generating enzyme family protein n=1 Tax=Rhodopirellula sp. P2 TaxID=2127060 RepID=UPI0023677487|nr:bifunctional serine/threonine-protein kinase/formylglycine-generating enzyme family protein [Rhodopirellula sp. P2]WDQ14725.1 SUMF1/EgtB/PvdO family nonheme iron enzyme [Rhodopirellula sp. P2]
MASDSDLPSETPASKTQPGNVKRPPETSQVDATVASGRAAPDIETPDWIGRYRVIRRIGSGGFGSVFQAKDESLNRDVAIKIPLRSLQDVNDEFQWTSEARMVAKLDHPNIVPVYDVGNSDEFPFFVVSRFIQGLDLRERLLASKPSLEEGLGWIRSIAEALHHAHSNGLVHRDVKPSNLLIDTQDRAWLTDFGLAMSDDAPRPTRAGLLIGTYSYMSPEQARGEGHLVDGRADIFALGIVLYELLVGRRPFSGGSSQQLLQDIVRAEPKPLRQFDPNLPIELERICLKALAQRVSDRYPTAAAMAADLGSYQTEECTVDYSGDLSATFLPGTNSLSPPGVLANSPRPDAEPRVIPKGLRAFDQHDRSFFLQLVPGARDARGVPEVLRQLKIRIDSRDIDEAFRVALIYGPSGSGKSSLMQAGLVPLLDASVEVVSVEANATHTESRLLAALQKLDSNTAAESTLIGAMASIRKNGVGGGKKVLVIVDQFEQWLHIHPRMQDEVLVDAIRQCDGKNLQCLLLIRDDFWMPATQFFHELDLRLVQDVNCIAVDRFDRRHAHYVLTEFGRAYGCLPEDLGRITAEQTKFIARIIEAVQENGRVISIHLAVLAQMLKSRTWDLKTLAEFGGAEGVDIVYLQSTFEDSNASPHHRRLRDPAKAVLAELLPERGAKIKGQMKDLDRLQEVAGLDHATFGELIEALDGELRLITPTAALDGVDSDVSQRSYQLTHDFLVEPIRDWLTQSDRQSIRGRARLRLNELTEYWKPKRENRFLPSGLDYLRFLALTAPAQRTEDQAKLMTASARYHGTRWAIAAALLVLAGLAVATVNQNIANRLANQETESMVSRLLAADVAMVPQVIETMQPFREEAEPRLQFVLADSSKTPREVLAARLALVDQDPSQIEPLIDAISQSNHDTLGVIAERLALQPELATRTLWSRFQSDTLDEDRRLRLAWVLAQLDPVNPDWKHHASRLVQAIVNQNPTRVGELTPGFTRIAEHIIEPAVQYFAPTSDANQFDPGSDVRLNAAFLISHCLTPADPLLKDLLIVAEKDQFELLLSVAKTDPRSISQFLNEELKQRARPTWTDAGKQEPFPEINVELKDEITGMQGLVGEAFAMVQRCPWDDFESLARSMQPFGFRPECVRVYEKDQDSCVAAVFKRDGLDWRFTGDEDRESVEETQQAMRDEGFYPCDVTAVPVGVVNTESEPTQMLQKYGVLWTERPPGVIDSRIYLGLSGSEHQAKGWEPLLHSGFVPKSNLKRRHPSGSDRYSSVRHRLVAPPMTEDAWNESPYGFQTRVTLGKYQTDIRLNPRGEFDEDTLSYAAVWWNGGAFESKTLERLPAEDHWRESKGLAAAGYRLASLSLVEDGESVAASVWLRPVVTDEQKDHVASRQANAIIALARLGSAEHLWKSLEDAPDPRLRSFLMDRLASLSVPSSMLLEQLRVEGNESRRFALLASLARYRPEQLPADDLRELKTLVSDWGTKHPQASIHSICRYLANRWKWDQVVEQIDQSHRPSSSADNVSEAASVSDADELAPGWDRNGQGQTMVTIQGPVEFVMGSPGHESFRDHSLEIPIRTKIPRTFAIADAEVTLAQYQRFDPDASYATQYALQPDCPMTSVGWFEAIKYCRWLSEQEGIPESQMCYPSIQEIEASHQLPEGIKRPKDFLERTGYRLPTEAEWEYACRGRTHTPRSYGNSPELLSQYAWTTEGSAQNSRVLFRPVRQLLPNPFGLFDTLGNVMEWCETHEVSRRENKTMIVDTTNGLIDNQSTYRAARGSAVFYIPTTMRSAKREQEKLYTQHPYLGFRVARTLQVLEEPSAE